MAAVRHRPHVTVRARQHPRRDGTQSAIVRDKEDGRHRRVTTSQGGYPGDFSKNQRIVTFGRFAAVTFSTSDYDSASQPGHSRGYN
jgi:hypothetical protein